MAAEHDGAEHDVIRQEHDWLRNMTASRQMGEIGAQMETLFGGSELDRIFLTGTPLMRAPPNSRVDISVREPALIL